MKKIIISILGVGFIAAAGILAYSQINKDEAAPAQNNSAQQPVPEQAVPAVSFSENGKVVSYNGQDGKAALDILKNLTTVEVKPTSFGDMVTAINGVKADDSKEFWAFYVNGQQAGEGAATYKTSVDEKIEWKLEPLEL